MTNFSGDKKGWPVYLSLGNVNTNIRSKISNRCYVLIALLPVPPKHTFKGPGKQNALRDQQDNNREILRCCFEIILRPLNDVQKHGKLMICPDGRMRLCFPIVCGWVADYAENVTLHSIRNHWCPVCEAPKASHGDPKSSSYLRRNYTEYFEQLTVATDDDAPTSDREAAQEYLQARGVRLSEGVFWSMPCVSSSTLITPDVLHTIYLGLLKHLMEWIVAFLEHHKLMPRFNELWRLVPAYPGFVQFNKPYTAVSQWQGKEMKALGRVIVPIFSATLITPSAAQKGPFKDAILCVKGFVYFHLMTQYRSHTEETLQYMEDYLNDFHAHKHVFHRFRAGKSAKKDARELKAQLTVDMKTQRESELTWNKLSKAAKCRREDDDKVEVEKQIEASLKEDSHFNFIKMHLLTHFAEHIRELGNLSNFTAELSESCHRDLKEAFRHSNKVNADPQILRSISRRLAFEYRELNVDAAKRRANDCIPPPVPRNRRLQNRRRDIKTLTDLATWCDMPDEDFQNHVAWCFKRFHEIPHYVNDEVYYGRLAAAKYTRYESAAIPVQAYQEVEQQVVHMIRCTGKNGWRKSKPPRNDAVLLWNGTNPESHFIASRGRIPARVDCFFHVEDTESGYASCMALVTTMAIGPIRQPEGMIMVEIREQPAIRPLANGTRRRQPLFRAGTRYLVPITAIQGAAHLIPIDPVKDSHRWYLNNTIDLTAFNLLW